jgi:Holliday junction resolvase RusA-like endonuclease
MTTHVEPLEAAAAPAPVDVVELVIRAVGNPVPQGSHHAQIVGKGRAIVVASNANGLRRWRRQLRDAAESAMNARSWLTLTGAVEVDVVFLLPRPRTVKRLLPTVPPDADKLARTLDALTDAGVWADDARVVDLHVRKRYAEGTQPAGARIVVRPAEQVIV